MDNARRLLESLTRQLERAEESRRTVPDPSPPGRHAHLCVGVLTVNDFDSVYFTIQSMRLVHREVLGDTSFLIIDNHPERVISTALRELADDIPGVRYVPFRGYRSSAVRDLIFREADAEIVMCVDPQVLLRPGALRAVLAYFAADPESLDIVQGPLLDASLDHVVGTHLDPVWNEGMFGRWAVDDRIHMPGAEPFEIGMQGLQVFACRKEAWPGINPRFRGFGGEEGYLHEKFRQNGGRTMCLPELAWRQCSDRPGLLDDVSWEDRFRNYEIGWAEVGWDATPVKEHYRSQPDGDEAESTLGRVKRQLENPFMFFDAVFCLNAEAERDRWAEMERRFAVLDIKWRVERFPVSASGDQDRDRVLSFRSLIEVARTRHYESTLVFADEVVFIDQTLTILADAVRDLASLSWDVFLLGGSSRVRANPLLDGSVVLQIPDGVSRALAIAFNCRACDRLLDELPTDNGREMDTFVSEHGSIDQYLHSRIASRAFRALVTLPQVSSQVSLLHQQNDALAARYII